MYLAKDGPINRLVQAAAILWLATKAVRAKQRPWQSRTRYLSVIKTSFVALAFLLISFASFAGNASAVTTTAHEIGGMNHSQNSTNSCALQCRTAVLNYDANNVQLVDDNDGEDDSTLPFYVVASNWDFSENLVKQRQYADAVKPPPKIPLYIRYAVFRV